MREMQAYTVGPLAGIQPAILNLILSYTETN